MLGGAADTTHDTIYDTHSDAHAWYDDQFWIDLPMWLCLGSWVWSVAWIVLVFALGCSCKVGRFKNRRLKPPPGGFEAGDNVEALEGHSEDGAGGGAKWVPGTVKEVLGEGFYDVLYKDGSTETMVAEALISPANTPKSRYVPMNIGFSLHRWGEWIMLMLGESVLSLLIVSVKEELAYYATFFSGVISVILLQYIHFQSQPHHADHHALRRSIPGALTWSICMDCYSASLIALGASYKMMLYEFSEDHSSYDSSAEHSYDSGNSTATHYPTSAPTVHDRLLGASAPSSLQEGVWEGGRRLAGGGGGAAASMGWEERQQRIANIFCASLTITLILLEVMTLAHKGLRKNMEWLSAESEHCRLKKGFFIFTKFAVIAFTATISSWVTDCEQVAIAGTVVCIILAVLQIVEWILFEDTSEGSAVRMCPVSTVVAPLTLSPPPLTHHSFTTHTISSTAHTSLVHRSHYLLHHSHIPRSPPPEHDEAMHGDVENHIGPMGASTSDLHSISGERKSSGMRKFSMNGNGDLLILGSSSAVTI
jgi:hypothetical protein